MNYLFILGRQPILSLAEIAAAVPDAKITAASAEAAAVECAELAPGFLNSLGGTVKIAAVDRELGAISEANAESLRLALPPRDGRVIFGISAYGHFTPAERRTLYMEGLELKKSLKGEGRRARYVVSRDTQLSSVVVAKNKLIEEGAELVIVRAQNKMWLGRTLAVQEFEAYGERDFDRPGRSARRGMLPPKLCQIMINLAQGDRARPLLDPFCGSGTVLGEALLMGYEQVIGSDLSAEAVADAKKYLDWLAESRPELRGRARVSECDARLVDKALAPDSVGAAVFEPLLGPPQSGRETPAILASLMQKGLVPLYRESLASISRALRPGAAAVVSFPVFNRQRDPIFVPIDEVRGDLYVAPLLRDVPLPRGLRFTPSGGALYERPDQFVGREIIILRK